MIPVSSNFLTANAVLAKHPIFLLSITGYARVFTNYATGIAGQYPWIESMGDLSISVSDLDGGADLSELSVTVQDRMGQVTADLPGSLLEGRIVTLKTGLVGMAQADFATLFTGVVDTIIGANNNLSYTFNCSDVSQVLTKTIFTVGDSSLPTDSNNLRTINAHPIDILVEVLTTEVGIDPSQINLAKLYGYRDGTYAGMQFTFAIDSPPVAKDFIENELMKPLGGYIWVNSRGQFDVNFFYPTSVIPVYSGSLIGAWVDGSGQLVSTPFLIGNGVIKKAPTGAVALQMGVNDGFYTDNAGGWDVTVNGTPVAGGVGASHAPWVFTGGINSAYSGSFVGAAAPISVAVTAGTMVTIAVINYADELAHGVSTHGAVGVHFYDGNGQPGVASPTGSPGKWASPAVIFKTPVMNLTIDNTLEIPLAEQADLVNVVDFRFDKSSGGTFLAEDIEKYAKSIARFGEVGAGQLYGSQVIESEGMRSGLQGFFLAQFVSRMIFLRYGLKNLMYQNVPHLWTTCVLEPGDIVNVSNRFVPDRANGISGSPYGAGIQNKLMEVMDRDWNFAEGTVTLKLLDASYLSGFGSSLIAPDGEAVFTSASADDKKTYLFLANTSDQYSDGTAANLLG